MEPVSIHVWSSARKIPGCPASKKNLVTRSCAIVSGLWSYICVKARACCRAAGTSTEAMPHRAKGSDAV
eukprot:11213166-Lingulodinium_polyedra.AAC.1